MRRNGFGAGSFLLGILVGIVLLILIAFAVSSNSTVQFNEPSGSSQPTNPPGQLQREKGSPEGTVTFNARAEWDKFIAELAAIPQAIVNWVRSLGGAEVTAPRIIIVTPTP
jgi:hypothetical protein